MADGGDPADASQPDAGPIDAGPPSVASLPAPPDLSGCEGGWREVEVDGIALCDPWPAGGIGTCAGVEAHFPGEPGCRAPGEPCDGEWPSDLPASGVIFVRPLGTATGTGTIGDPFGTVDQAVAVAMSGTTIALARGRHAVRQLDLPSGVRVVGACAGETTLASADASADFGVVSVFGSTGGEIADLRIEGARPGVFVGAGGQVTVRGVVVEDAETWGMIADDGGELVAVDVVVRGTRAFGGFDLGEGIYARRGGQASVTRAVVEGNVQHGVYAEGAGTALTLTDVAVRDTTPGLMGFRGVGVLATNEAVVTLRRVTVDRVLEAAVMALLDARIDADRLVTRDVSQSVGLTSFGAGLLARASGHVDARRVLVERASHAGAIVDQVGSELALTDALVRETTLAAAPEPDRWGMGIVAQQQGSLRLLRAAAVGNHFVGIFGVAAGRLELDDVTVRATRGVEAGAIYGRGLELQEGATATVRRAAFVDNRDVAVSLTDPGSALTAEDLTLGETLATGGGRFGYGLQVVDGATAALTRASLRGLRGAGVLIARASVSATGLDVAGGRLMDCATDGRCGAEGAAYDVVVLDGGAATIGDFRLEGAPTAALQLASTGVADLSSGVVASSPIGFNVQNPGFDEARLRAGVTLVGVGTELDRSALPILSIPPFGI